MRFVPVTRPPTGSGAFRGWRVLILLFAGLLTLGVFQPITASASPALLSVKDKTVVEANSGTRTANVKIVLSQKFHKKVTVGYRTVDGTAEAGSDYVAASGQVKFPNGTKVAFVHIAVIGDTVEEPDEYFKVRLFDAFRARIADRVGVVTVIDTDVTPPPPPAPPALSVSDTKVHEGDPAYFKVSLDKPAPDVVTFRYATSDGTADAGQDYDATSGVKSIDKGDTWTVVRVWTREDSLFEPGPDETFFLNVYAVEGATVADGHGKAFIDDNDPPPPPKLFVKGDKVDEGGKAFFKVFLSDEAHHPVFFKYATEDGSAKAGPAKDYLAADGSVVIYPGHRFAVIPVQTNDDSVDEYLENFFLKVTDVKGAIPVDPRGESLIEDNDAEPNVAINDTTVTAEGYHAVLKITLSAPSEKVVKVHWATADGPVTGGAQQPGDYTQLSGTVTFAPGDPLNKEINPAIATVDDADKEGAEIFFVNISAENATINQFHSKGTVTIPASD